MKLLVELLQEQASRKYPSRRVAVVIHLPLLGNDTIAHDARIAYEGIDSIRGHHGNGILIPYGFSRMLPGIIAGCNNE